LLLRAKDPADRAAWREFEELYRLLLLRFCRARGLQHADAEDVVQTVFVNIANSLPQFVYDRQRGRFRDYLYRCVRNTLADWARRSNRHPRNVDSKEWADLAAALSPDAGGDADGRLWHEEWVAHHYRLALATIRTDFDPRSVEIFERNVAGEGVADLAAAFGVSEPSIYALRRRIRQRMQELIRAQIEEEDAFDENRAT